MVEQAWWRSSGGRLWEKNVNGSKKKVIFFSFSHPQKSLNLPRFLRVLGVIFAECFYVFNVLIVLCCVFYVVVSHPESLGSQMGHLYI